MLGSCKAALKGCRCCSCWWRIKTNMPPSAYINLSCSPICGLSYQLNSFIIRIDPFWKWKRENEAIWCTEFRWIWDGCMNWLSKNYELHSWPILGNIPVSTDIKCICFHRRYPSIAGRLSEGCPGHMCLSLCTSRETPQKSRHGDDSGTRRQCVQKCLSDTRSCFQRWPSRRDLLVPVSCCICTFAM